MNLLTLQLASKRPDIRRAREGCVWRDLDGSVCGRSLIAGHDRWLDWYDVGVLAFNDRSPVVKVWPVRGMTLESARAEFDRMLRPIVLQALGWQALHAGAALTSEGALGRREVHDRVRARADGLDATRGRSGRLAAS